MSELKTEVVKGPATLRFAGGGSLHFETTITTVDDWHETPFGRVNFGHVNFGPQRAVFTPTEIPSAKG